MPLVSHRRAGVGRLPALCFAAVAVFTTLVLFADLARADSAEGTVSIRVGREISITFVLEGALLTSPTVLPEPTEGEGIVTVKLTRSGPSRTLYVTNGFGLPLLYKVRIRMKGRGGQLETVMAPVPPHQEGLVSFGDPIDELVLFDFRLKDAPLTQ